MSKLNAKSLPLVQLQEENLINISSTATDALSKTPVACKTVLGSNGTTSSNKKSSSLVFEDVLKNVVAFVEVRSEMEDLSLLFGEHLLYLGATVSRTFNKKVTHVLFKRGRESTFKKAMERNIPVVSVVWLDRCKNEKRHVPEEPYLIKDYKTYGKRPKLLYGLKHTKTIEDNERSFEESKRIVENIKQRLKEETNLVTQSPHPSPKNCPSTPSLPISTSETVLPITSKRKNRRKVIVEQGETKRKLFSEGGIFLGSPVSKSTPVNKKQRARSPLKESNTKRFKSSDRKENDTSILLNEIDNNNLNNDSQKRESALKLHAALTKDTNKAVVVDVLKCRRSLEDFQLTKKPHERTTRKKAKSENDVKQMVFTAFNSEMNDTAYAIVKALGGFEIVNNVTKNTTHVICGDNKRTLNVLYGLMRGCFILNGDWLMSSLEANKWLDEKLFELVEYFPSSQVRKPEIINIFKGCGKFFISPGSSPPAVDLANLITLGGGEVTTCYRKCNVIVGNFKNHSTDEDPDITHVDEKFILDCISNFQKFKV